MAVSESTARHYETHDPDVRLMLQVRDDDAAAFEQLVRRYQGRLLTVLEHLVGRREPAEDLAQEVFLRVYRARKNYVPGAKFSTWLFTIAANVASNARRSRGRRREYQLGRSDGSDSSLSLDQMISVSSGQIPARHADKLERAAVVRVAIQSLSERQKMALLLSKFEEMSYAEIAQTMDISVQAVKSLLSRARISLRDMLLPYLDEGSLPPASQP